MIDFFSGLYPDTNSKKITILDRVRFYSLVRFTVRQTANIVLPIYFQWSNIFKNKYKLEKSEKEDLIVSFTSFPTRINKVWLVVESLLRQSVKPDKIILWLSKEQFHGINELPDNLLKQRKRGLEIVLCEGDLRSHKKYYYTVKQFPNSVFVIIDDDVLYPSRMLENLLEFHSRYPDTVCFNRGYKIMAKENEIEPYSTWRTLVGMTGPQAEIIPIGAGAVLYPPNVLHKDIIDVDVFMKYCKYADDLWLYAMVQLNQKKLVKSDNNQRFLPVLYRKNTTLTSINVRDGKNDEQLKAIRKYYQEEKGIDIFETIVNK